MRIPDISKIDIKDIDVGKIRNEILDHKEISIQVVCVIVSLFFMFSVFNTSKGKIETHKARIAALLGKTGLIEEYKKVDQKISDFISKVPAHIPEDKMVDLVTDYAGKNKVKILTFSQAKVNKKDTVETTTVTFSLTADTFVDMVKFLVDIETGEKFVQVSSCNVSPRDVSLRADAGSKEKDKLGVPISFRIEVVSLKVN